MLACHFHKARRFSRILGGDTILGVTLRGDIRGTLATGIQGDHSRQGPRGVTLDRD